MSVRRASRACRATGGRDRVASEAADILGVGKRRALYLVKDGRLPVRPLGNSFVALRSDVEKLKAIPRKPGPKPKKK
ncbi:MAG TPA: helix-turn-helix domain-containing protein [Urbifossiella sp.]|nr:helix-turn-helix domain-containing protein [Urbifossiella sp.]